MWYSYLKENVKKNLKHKYLASFLIDIWSEKETFYFGWGGRVQEYRVWVQMESRRDRRWIIVIPGKWDWGTIIRVRFCHEWQKLPKTAALGRWIFYFPLLEASRAGTAGSFCLVLPFVISAMVQGDTRYLPGRGMEGKRKEEKRAKGPPMTSLRKFLGSPHVHPIGQN